jgi:hypothetical protein
MIKQYFSTKATLKQNLTAMIFIILMSVKKQALYHKNKPMKITFI